MKATFTHDRSSLISRDISPDLCWSKNRPREGSLNRYFLKTECDCSNVDFHSSAKERKLTSVLSVATTRNFLAVGITYRCVNLAFVRAVSYKHSSTYCPSPAAAVTP